MNVIRLCLIALYLFMQSSATTENHSTAVLPEEDGVITHSSSNNIFEYLDLCEDQVTNHSFLNRYNYHQSTLNSWYFTYQWLLDCINNGTYYDFSCAIEEMNNLKTSYSDWTSIRDIEEQFNLIEGYKEISEIYFRNYNLWKMDINISKNSTVLQVDGCYQPQYFKFIKTQQGHIDIYYNDLFWVYIYSKYIEIVPIMIIISLGVIMDGTLLLIFIMNKDMRTEQNMIVLNIAICDFLGLFTLPIQYVALNKIPSAPVLIIISILAHKILITVSAFSVMALSIQRYIAVSNSMKKITPVSYQRDRSRKINGYIVTIWSIEVIILLLLFIGSECSKFMLIVPVLVFGLLIVIGVLLPLAVTFLNLLTSRNLKQSSRRIPGEGTHESVIQSRYRSSRIIAGLCISFWVTHTPLTASVFCLIISKDFKIMFRYILALSYNLFSCNAFLNPLALIICGKNYRDYFKRYLFLRRCHCQKVQIPNSVI